MGDQAELRGYFARENLQLGGLTLRVRSVHGGGAVWRDVFERARRWTRCRFCINWSVTACWPPVRRVEIKSAGHGTPQRGQDNPHQRLLNVCQCVGSAVPKLGRTCFSASPDALSQQPFLAAGVNAAARNRSMVECFGRDHFRAQVRAKIGATAINMMSRGEGVLGSCARENQNDSCGGVRLRRIRASPSSRAGSPAGHI